MRSRSLRRAVPLLVVAGVLAGPFAAPVAATGVTITINSVGDVAGNDGLCSIREAIVAANTNTASGALAGECAAGSAAGSDTIAFGFASRTVTLTAALPDIASDLVINGGGSVTLDLAGHGRVTKAAGAVTLKGLTILNGSTGAVFNDLPGSLVIADATISGSTGATAVYNGGSLTLERVTLSGNAVGGLYNNATATVLDTRITGNTATFGAGIYNAGPLVVKRTTVADNNAAGGSGGGLYNNSTATVTASTFSGNIAASGGGIFAAFALTLGNVTISDNSATTQGGGIFNNTTLTGTNVTITRNASPVPGSGFYNALSAILKNTIIAGNTGTDYAGNVLSVGSGHNRIAPLAGVVLTDVLSDDGLQQNGGPTATVRLVNTATNPFNTAGDATACAAAPISGRDQRGVVRPAASCSVGAVQLERKSPGVGIPTAGFRTGGTLIGSATGGRVTWTGADPAGGSGIDRYLLSRSFNGGAWVTIASSLPSAHGDTPMTSGKTYRFRVRAVDNDGNVSAWAYGVTVRPAIRQQTSTSIRYGKTWSTASSGFFSGGSVRWAKAAGASASVTATGRAYAFVTTTALTRGKARVYVNGVLKATIDLRSDAIGYRFQAWSIRYGTSATRTIKVVVLGTSGRPRVDLDAFLVLR